MYLKYLHLKNFRNHLDLSLHFHPKVNLITGDNGIGKTNILEAIYFISTGKSFRTSCLDELISHTSSFFISKQSLLKKTSTKQLKLATKTKKNKSNITLQDLTILAIYQVFFLLFYLLPKTFPLSWGFRQKEGAFSTST